MLKPVLANAWSAWTSEEETKVIHLIREWKSITEISKTHKRKPSGIKALLIKLGLIKK